MPGRLFISYARADGAEVARNIKQRLSETNPPYQVWLDVDDCHSGLHWPTETRKAIQTCDIALVLITERSCDESSICVQEVDWIHQLQKPFIPVRIHRDAQKHFLLANVNEVRLDPFEQGFALLLRELIWHGSPAGALSHLRRRLDHIVHQLKDPSCSGTKKTQLTQELTDTQKLVHDQQTEIEAERQPPTPRRLSGPRKPVPELLPFCADRMAQRDAIFSLIQDWQEAKVPSWIVCFLHGDGHQCLDAFLRYCEQELLPVELLPKLTFHLRHFDFKFHERKLEDLQARWRLEMAKELGVNPDLDEISSALRSRSTATLLRVDIPSERWDRVAPARVEQFLNFWGSMEPPLFHQPVFIFITVTYRLPTGWYTRRKTRKLKSSVSAYLQSLTNQSYPRVTTRLMPELTDIQQHEVEFWARTRCSEFASLEMLIEGIQQIFSEPDIRTSGAVPMRQLAAKLSKLLHSLEEYSGPLVH